MSRQSKPTLFISSVVSAVVIGFFDYITGQDYYFFIFYAIPIFIVTWYVGKTQGYMMALFCLIAWFLDDTLDRPPFADPFIPLWNIFVKFAFYIILIEVLTALKAALQREKEAQLKQIEHDIDIARQVQQRLFPQFTPPSDSLDYCGICEPASKIGGDYYDYFPVGEDKIAIAIGDVCGHGVPAALLMASVEAFVRSNSQVFDGSLETFIREMNLFLFQTTEENKFVSFFYSVYDENSRKLVYVNAGHNPPLLLRQGSFSRLEKGGMVLGAIEYSEYEQGELNLKPGDLLLLYTDGVTEAMNDNGDFFGEERLEKVLLTGASLNAEALQSEILKNVNNFSGSRRQEDDITLVVIRVKN